MVSLYKTNLSIIPPKDSHDVSTFLRQNTTFFMILLFYMSMLAVTLTD